VSSKTRFEEEAKGNPEMAYCLKGHSQLVHMRIRYHFVANLPIFGVQSILILTKYSKNSIIRLSNSTLKNGVFQSMIKNQAKHYEN